jgi:hypothetical protein
MPSLPFFSAVFIENSVKIYHIKMMFHGEIYFIEQIFSWKQTEVTFEGEVSTRIFMR